MYTPARRSDVSHRARLLQGDWLRSTGLKEPGDQVTICAIWHDELKLERLGAARDEQLDDGNRLADTRGRLLGSLRFAKIIFPIGNRFNILAKC